MLIDHHLEPSHLLFVLISILSSLFSMIPLKAVGLLALNVLAVSAAALPSPASDVAQVTIYDQKNFNWDKDTGKGRTEMQIPYNMCGKIISCPYLVSF